MYAFKVSQRTDAETSGLSLPAIKKSVWRDAKIFRPPWRALGSVGGPLISTLKPEQDSVLIWKYEGTFWANTWNTDGWPKHQGPGCTNGSPQQWTDSAVPWGHDLVKQQSGEGTSQESQRPYEIRQREAVNCVQMGRAAAVPVVLQQ